ncbi:MAG TPA: YciK family oxidoreductase [Gammaproteobacteria bacterium]|nr:YciK family oxidoreductase [Gammaproteobacteria bacterium]
MQIPDDWQPETQCLKGRVILVTGAGNGIGAAVAKRCAHYGASVILLDKTVRNLEQVYDAIESAGDTQAAIYPMDLEGATEKDFYDLAGTIEKEFGQLDGLLHNAAMLGALVPVAHFESELWFRILQVNLNAPFLLTRACLDLLLHSADASVLFSSDAVGKHGKAYWGAYAASKAGLENFMQTLADELESNTRVRVNSLDPGVVASGLRTIAYPGENPHKLASPEDVVRPHLYLLGPDSQGLTGRQFTIHGDSAES